METYLKVGTLSEAGLQKMGVAILSEHLRAAAVAFLKAVTPIYRAEQIHQSVAFVSGSGIQVIVESYGLDYDANQLQSTFLTWARRQHHRIVASSSVIMSAPHSSHGA